MPGRWCICRDLRLLGQCQILFGTAWALAEERLRSIEPVWDFHQDGGWLGVGHSPLCQASGLRHPTFIRQSPGQTSHWSFGQRIATAGNTAGAAGKHTLGRGSAIGAHATTFLGLEAVASSSLQSICDAGSQFPWRCDFGQPHFEEMLGESGRTSWYAAGKLLGCRRAA